MTAQELWTKYSFECECSLDRMDEENFVKALAEALSIPLELPVILQGEPLPCPFCGDKPEKYTVGARPYFGERGVEYVRCKNPKCGFWGHPMMLDKWNKRAGREP